MRRMAMKTIYKDIKRGIKAIVLARGYAIEKATISFHYLSKRKPPVVNHKTKGKLIEFLGPSGVGKTTLLKKLNPNIISQWLNREDFGQLSPPKDLFLGRKGVHADLFSRQSISLDYDRFGDFNRFCLLSYNLAILKDDLLFYTSDLPQGLLLDEGLGQCFARELLSSSDEAFARIMKNRFFVFLLPKEPSWAVQNVKKRLEQGGHLGLSHHGCDDVEICQETISFTQTLLALSKRIEASELRACHLIAEDGIEHNAAKLELFINTL